MEVTFRLYDIEPEALDEWAREWREHVVPLRRAAGFEILGGWPIRETSQFAWVLAYAGEEGFDAADERYYTSPERVALDPDPARHVRAARAWKVEPAL